MQWVFWIYIFFIPKISIRYRSPAINADFYFCLKYFAAFCPIVTMTVNVNKNINNDIVQNRHYHQQHSNIVHFSSPHTHSSILCVLCLSTIKQKQNNKKTKTPISSFLIKFIKILLSFYN